MSDVEGFTGRERQIAATGSGYNIGGFQHFKYPLSVGNDTGVDDINFNSNEASEYANLRMKHTSTMTKEPFIMMEFLRVDETDQQQGTLYRDTKSAILEKTNKTHKWYQTDQAAKDLGAMNLRQLASASGDKIKELSTSIVKSLTTPVKREYIGSVSIYMPTDIAIGDTMVYNEDTRQFAAGMNELLLGSGKNAFDNTAVAGSKAAITGAAAVLGKGVGKGIVGALVGYGLGDIVSTEMQRSSGALLNPNEFIAYQSTGLRNFNFNWTLLPDSEKESDEIANMIKFMRSAAHAKKNSQITVTVPDHCIVSFHGAKDMIQLPPCVVETVTVTYNPNVSSFFKKNNAPVEVGLGVTLKEMVPLYRDDVEAGY